VNEKNNRNFIITIVILSALFTISAGFNFGLGRCIPDNQRLREQQRELKRTVEQLTVERDAERETVRELRRLHIEAKGIIDDIIGSTETTGSSLATANKILRQVIISLQSLDLLYSRDRDSGNNGLGNVDD